MAICGSSPWFKVPQQDVPFTYAKTNRFFYGCIHSHPWLPPHHSTSLTPMTLKLQNHLPKATTQAETMNCRPLGEYSLCGLFLSKMVDLSVYISVNQLYEVNLTLNIVGSTLVLQEPILGWSKSRHQNPWSPCTTSLRWKWCRIYIISGSHEPSNKKRNRNKNKYIYECILIYSAFYILLPKNTDARLGTE